MILLHADQSLALIALLLIFNVILPKESLTTAVLYSEKALNRLMKAKEVYASYRKAHALHHNVYTS